MIVRSTILPSDLQDALAEVSAKLEHGNQLGPELDRALGLLKELSPAQIGRVDSAIAEAAHLHHRAPQRFLTGLLFPRATDRELLFQAPGLEYLFLFHRDGRLREAALLKITGGLPTPFLFAAVVWRLNDWVAPVREAAVRCARRSFPATAPDVIAQAATALLVRRLSWQRWTDERTILNEELSRADVAEHLTQLLIHGATGPLSSVLRSALRTSELDPYLMRLAVEALQPSVRAVALDALINGKATWTAGYVWQWVDKSMGRQRRVPTFDSRVLTVAPQRIPLITDAVTDRSAIVRGVALTGVVRHLLGTPEGRALAAPLLTDRSPFVRETAKFIVRADVA
jgi:hypothetical protein